VAVKHQLPIIINTGIKPFILIIYYHLVADREVLKEQALGYVKAIQWILQYYFKGVPSWSWLVVEVSCLALSCAHMHTHTQRERERDTHMMCILRCSYMCKLLSFQVLSSSLCSLSVGCERFQWDENGV